MATTFAYKVRDKEGRLLEGSLEAETVAGVASLLRAKGYVPVDIAEHVTSTLKRDIRIPGLSDRVSQKDVAVFARQLATMINGGLSLIRSLTILGEQTENKTLCGIIDEVRTDVEKGTALSVALGRHPKAFSHLFVSMVKAGETGGVLDSVLLRLATIIEKQVELKRKITSAMTYPVAVLGLVLVVVTAMMLFVVPTFKGMYADAGGTLPLPTRILLAMSSIGTRFAPVFILLIVGGVVGFKRWLASTDGRARWDAFKLRVPIFGPLVHKTSLTRFARTLSILLRSGVPILESLEITSETVNNAVVSAAVSDVQDAVTRGDTISEPLASHDVFPPMVTQMLAVGEETGMVDEMMEKVADFYDQEVEAAVDALTSLLEPLLIVILGGAVGGMVVALYMPMFNIINTVH